MTAADAVKVDGLAQLLRSLHRAGDELADLKAANQEAATIALHGAQARVPTGTGRLAASGRTVAQEGRARFQFGNAQVPYAAIIHWGWPDRGIAADTYGSDGARKTEPLWTAAYSEAIQEVCDSVKGA